MKKNRIFTKYNKKYTKKYSKKYSKKYTKKFSRKKYNKKFSRKKIKYYHAVGGMFGNIRTVVTENAVAMARTAASVAATGARVVVDASLKFSMIQRIISFLTTRQIVKICDILHKGELTENVYNGIRNILKTNTGKYLLTEIKDFNKFRYDKFNDESPNETNIFYNDNVNDANDIRDKLEFKIWLKMINNKNKIRTYLFGEIQYNIEDLFKYLWLLLYYYREGYNEDYSNIPFSNKKFIELYTNTKEFYYDTDKVMLDSRKKNYTYGSWLFMGISTYYKNENLDIITIDKKHIDNEILIGDLLYYIVNETPITINSDETSPNILNLDLEFLRILFKLYYSVKIISLSVKKFLDNDISNYDINAITNKDNSQYENMHTILNKSYIYPFIIPFIEHMKTSALAESAPAESAPAESAPAESVDAASINTESTGTTNASSNNGLKFDYLLLLNIPVSNIQKILSIIKTIIIIPQLSTIWENLLPNTNYTSGNLDIMIDALLLKLTPFGNEKFKKQFMTVVKKRMEIDQLLKEKTLTEYRKLYYLDETFRKICRMIVSEFSEESLKDLFDPENLAVLLLGVKEINY